MPEVDQETIDLLVSQIKSMEAQLAGLRAKVERLGEPAPVRTLADLYGERRAITSGVSRDGTMLMPPMAFHYYKNISAEDLDALVAYLRTIEPLPDAQ